MVLYNILFDITESTHKKIAPSGQFSQNENSVIIYSPHDFLSSF